MLLLTFHDKYNPNDIEGIEKSLKSLKAELFRVWKTLGEAQE